MNRELLWFGIIGVSAMLVHFLLVAVILVPFGLPPLLANVVAFLLAFQVSYWGHRHKTFDAAHVPHRQALPRFFMVSCLSFALNEAMYFVLLHFTTLDYRLALLIVLASVAVFTFVLSKLWAFSDREQAA
ncbi:GtrA family protein [Aquitalea denitrificans]|uniref:GtrA family protein n=1 Tax=Aquitalea denitrificans TaxID=519081 RepID=UPI001358E45C|nr:GtrA family protein [Aquitalea denitrificans]